MTNTIMALQQTNSGHPARVTCSPKPASFEILDVNMFTGAYIVCISPFLPQFHGPRIKALLVAANRFRITFQREK